MTRFDALLFLLLAPLLVYTALVVQSHGLGLSYEGIFHH